MKKIILAFLGFSWFHGYAGAQGATSVKRLGSWEVVSHKGYKGDNQCYVINRSSPENQKISFTLASSPIENTVHVILRNKDWIIQDYKNIKVDFYFEGRGKYSLDGVSKDNMMIFGIDGLNKRIDFQTKLFSANSFIIRFIDSREPMWIISGDHMEDVSKSFLDCLLKAKKS